MSTATAKARDRRRHRRAPVSIIIDYAAADQFYSDYTLNLSLGGIFIRTDEVLPVGTHLKIHFSIPGLDDFIDAWGEVVRCNEEPVGDEPRGMALAFDDLDPKSKSLIENALEWLP